MLTGRSIVVTRTRAQASKLTAQLVALGAIVHEEPMITIGEPSDGGVALAAAVARLDTFAWCVLSSPNGAQRFVHALAAAGLTAGTIAPSIATIGPATAAVIEAAGGTVALVASRHVAEGLVDDFPTCDDPIPLDGSVQVLIPQAEVARPTLVDGLAALGWHTEVVSAYLTRPVALSPAALARIRGSDIVTFTSSSTVTNFFAATSGDDRSVMPLVASIGPVTSATARGLGLTVHIEAATHTIDGLVQALIEAHR